MTPEEMAVKKVAEVTSQVCDLFGMLHIDTMIGTLACVSITATAIALGQTKREDVLRVLDAYIKAVEDQLKKEAANDPGRVQ